MRISIRNRHMIVAATLLVLLSGCSTGGSSFSPTVQGPGPRSQSVIQNHVPLRLAPALLNNIHPSSPYRGKSFAYPSVGTLVYTCDYSANACEWFPLGSNTVAGTISGLMGPQGLAVGAGANTDVYIANTGASNVLVYPIGSVTLKTTLVDTKELPVDIAVAQNGTVYVANIFDTSGNAGNVTVFNKGSSTISRKIKDPNFYEVISATIDELNDLVVCYNDRNGVGACDEFPGGRAPGTTIVSGLQFAGGTQFDATEDLVVSDQLGHVYVYAPNDGTLCNTIASAGPSIAFDKAQTDVFVADTATGDINEETYSGCTGGGKVEFTYHAGSSGALAGVAVDPGPRN
jgi:hypothetical protein